MKELTDRQNDILAFIENFKEQKQYSPTLAEIGKCFNITKKGVVDHLTLIEKKGYIKREPKISRSIILLKDLQ